MKHTHKGLLPPTSEIDESKLITWCMHVYKVQLSRMAWNVYSPLSPAEIARTRVSQSHARRKHNYCCTENEIMTHCACANSKACLLTQQLHSAWVWLTTLSIIVDDDQYQLEASSRKMTVREVTAPCTTCSKSFTV